MRQICIINPHSMVDVITNSSTELFVCDTDKTIEVVKEILKSNKAVCGYQEPFLFSLEEYKKWKKKSSKDKYDNKFSCIRRCFLDSSDKQEMKDARIDIITSGPIEVLFGSIKCLTNSNNPYSKEIEEASNIDYPKEKEDYWKKSYDAKKKAIENIYKRLEKCKNKPVWWNNPEKYSYMDITVQELDGKIIIVGESDNSIPYEEWDWIRSTFNATNYHLG